MMTNNTDALVASSASGRGLWIGLFHKSSPELEVTRRSVLERNRFAETISADRSHLTIAHLGRKCPADVVHGAVAACGVVSGMVRAVSAEVQGIVRLRDHLAILLCDLAIAHIVRTVKSALIDRKIMPDGSFAGVQHVTIGKLVAGGDAAIQALGRFTLHFDEIRVQCGEASFKFELANQ